MDSDYVDLLSLIALVKHKPELVSQRLRERSLEQQFALHCTNLMELDSLSVETNWKPLHKVSLNAGLFALPELIHTEGDRFEPNADGTPRFIRTETPFLQKQSENDSNENNLLSIAKNAPKYLKNFVLTLIGGQA
jgi:hypothetical protein